MRLRAAPVFVIPLVLLLAALSIWVADLLRLPELGGRPPSPQNPEYVLENFTSVVFKADGSRDYLLRARQLRHFTDDNVTKVEAPRLTLFRGEPPPWESEAERGIVYEPEGRIDLLGRVEMYRPGHPDRPPLRITTRDLTVFTALDYAETAAAVHVVRSQDTIDAIGMRAWLAENRVELLENVLGRYARE